MSEDIPASAAARCQVARHVNQQPTRTRAYTMGACFDAAIITASSTGWCSASRLRAQRARRQSFLAHAVTAASAELSANIGALPPEFGPRLRERAFDHARIGGRRWLEPFLANERAAAEQVYRGAADRFVALANEFLEVISSAGAEGFDQLPQRLPEETSFRVASRYYYRELTPLVRGTPLRATLDMLRPHRRMIVAARRDAAAYLKRLLEMNSKLVENDLTERILESRRRLEGEIHALLRSVISTAQRVLNRARLVHAGGTSAVEAAIARLDVLGDEVASMSRALDPVDTL